MKIIPKSNGWRIAYSERADGSFRGRELEFAQSVGIPQTHVFSSLQVEHGARIAQLDQQTFSVGKAAADALIGESPKSVFGLSVGDCVPIVITDTVSSAGALIHGGWKSLAAGLLEQTILSLQKTFGSEPKHLDLWIGPCIRGNSYRFEQRPLQAGRAEWVNAVRQQEQNWSIDLPAYVLAAAERAGVPATNMTDCGLDTFTSPDVFYSHRRAVETQKPEEDGRIAVIAWRTL